MSRTCRISPSLIARDQLVDGNSKLEISRSGAQLAGPALAGGADPGAEGTAGHRPRRAQLSRLRALRSRHSQAGRGARSASRACRRFTACGPSSSEGLRYVLRSYVPPLDRGLYGVVQFFGNVMFSIFLVYAVRQLGSQRGHDWPHLRRGQRRPPGSVRSRPTASAAKIGVGPAIVAGAATGYRGNTRPARARELRLPRSSSRS